MSRKNQNSKTGAGGRSGPKPDGIRIARAEREVQGHVAQFLASAYKGELPGFVSVVRVTMPPDLRSARVSVSFLQVTPEEEKEGVLLLQRRAPEIQRLIADRMPMRHCPRLTFEIDRSTQQVLKIEGILRDLDLQRKAKGEAPLGDLPQDSDPDSETEN